MLRRWHATFFRTSVLMWPKMAYQYWRDRAQYKKMDKAEKLLMADNYPCLFDRLSVTSIDSHYFYQGLWGMRRIIERKPVKHVDVGSDNRWVGWMTTIVPVISIDIRPLPVEVDNLECRKGSALDLPFDDESVDSLSCMHVVEHVGLGRYGDPLDPEGTVKACKELARVLAPGGRLYLSLPVGNEKVCFNAHRIIDPTRVLSICEPLKLKEFSVIDNSGMFKEKCDPANYSESDYACGLYIFERSND